MAQRRGHHRDNHNASHLLDALGLLRLRCVTNSLDIPVSSVTQCAARPIWTPRAPHTHRTNDAKHTYYCKYGLQYQDTPRAHKPHRSNSPRDTTSTTETAAHYCCQLRRPTDAQPAPDACRLLHRSRTTRASLLSLSSRPHAHIRAVSGFLVLLCGTSRQNERHLGIDATIADLYPYHHALRMILPFLLTSIERSSFALTATFMSRNFVWHRTVAPASLHTRARDLSGSTALVRNRPERGHAALCLPHTSKWLPHSHRASVAARGSRSLSRTRVRNRCASTLNSGQVEWPRKTSLAPAPVWDRKWAWSAAHDLARITVSRKWCSRGEDA